MHLLTVTGILLLLDMVAGGCPTVRSRNSWKAAPPKAVSRLTSKPSVVVIKETAPIISNICYSSNTKHMQTRDMNVYHHNDIDCNIIFGYNGGVCEGRGWHNKVIGNDALVFCVMEDSKSALEVDFELERDLKGIFECDYVKKLLDPNYKIITLRDMMPTSLNPGKHLYKLIESLPHYKKVGYSQTYSALFKKNEKSWVIGR